MARFAWVMLVALLGCGGDSSHDDGGLDAGFDVGLVADGGSDAGSDAAFDARVDGAPDGGFDAALDAAFDAGLDGAAAPGFGAIAGPCPRITGELSTSTASLFSTRLDFGDDPFDVPEDVSRLTPGGQEIWMEGTLGGSSGESEVFAFEVLARCDGAALLKSESEIRYVVEGAKTDILVDFGGTPIGVSVTRAFVFPPSEPYTVALAQDLLMRKLSDILESSANVAPEDRWRKQILVVMAYADMHAESIMSAWAALDPSITADTIVYVVVTDGMDEPLY